MENTFKVVVFAYRPILGLGQVDIMGMGAAADQNGILDVVARGTE